MATDVFRIEEPAEYRRAGPTDLIRLLPAPGGHPLFVAKWQLEILISAVVQRELIHISGPTGSGKSSIIDALRQDNFGIACAHLGFPVKPLITPQNMLSLM